MNPKISVIMPVYNEEKFLNESMDSILNQTFKDFEFIIIDNGSEDKSLSIIKSYNDKRIKLVHLDDNIGATRALNMALKLAKSKYIAAFCADDISTPKRLELEFKYLEKNPHIFLVGGSSIYIDKKGKELFRLRKYEDSYMLAWRLKKSCGIVFPSIMFRNGGYLFDSNFITEDYNFYFELLKDGKNIVNIKDFLVKHRIHKNSFSIYNKPRMDASNKLILEKFKTLEPKIGFFRAFWYSLRILLHFIKTLKGRKNIKDILLKKIKFK